MNLFSEVNKNDQYKKKRKKESQIATLNVKVDTNVSFWRHLRLPNNNVCSEETLCWLYASDMRTAHFRDRAAVKIVICSDSLFC